MKNLISENWAVPVFLLTLVVALGSCSQGNDDDNSDTSNDSFEIFSLAVQNPKTWTWIPRDDHFCRDGSTTGFGLNLNPDSDKYMFYLQGGGACFNRWSCLNNPSSFGEDDLIERTTNGGGIFDRELADNPFSDWNQIYIPYCTGDLHSGNNANADVPNGDIEGFTLEGQMMVGAQNLINLISAVAPYIQKNGIGEGAFVGTSAGGVGVIPNFDRFAQAFPETKFTVIDDAGTIFINNQELFPNCFNELLDSLYLFDYPTDYDEFVLGTYDHKIQGIHEYLARKYNDVEFALISTKADQTFRLFYGFAKNECAHALDSIEPEMFETGLVEIQSQLSAFSNWKFHFREGEEHTVLTVTERIEAATVNNIPLSAWIDDLLNRNAENLIE